MKILNEGTDKPKLFVLILDEKEARTLVEMAETAVQANKKKSSFKKWKKKLEEQLLCY